MELYQQENMKTWTTRRAWVSVAQKLGEPSPVQEAFCQRKYSHAGGASNADGSMAHHFNASRRSTREAAQPTPELSEEAWQHRIDKRSRAIASLKDTDMYRLCSGTRPRTPDPADRALGKRQWDEVVTQWKRALRSASVQASPVPQCPLEEQGAKYMELASPPKALRIETGAATNTASVKASFCHEGGGDVGRRVSLKHCSEDGRYAPRDSGARRRSALGSQRRTSDADTLDAKESLKAWTKVQEEAQAAKESRKKLRRTLAFVALAVLGLAFDQLVFEKLAGAPAKQRVQAVPSTLQPQTMADALVQVREPGPSWTSMESSVDGENFRSLELDNSNQPVGACAAGMLPFPTTSD